MEAPEQPSAEVQLAPAIDAIVAALIRSSPDLLTRFLDMLRSGRVQRDTEIVLALSQDAAALRHFLSLLAMSAGQLVQALRVLETDYAARWGASAVTRTSGSPPATPRAEDGPHVTRPALDVAALVGESPFQPPPSYPPRPVLYAQLGHTFLHEGEQHQEKRQLNQARSAYLRAVESFSEALRRAPDHPELHLYLAEAHERLGQDAEALRQYVAALPLLPEKATPLLSRIHQMLTEELAPALTEHEEALEALAWSPDLETAARPRMEMLLARLALYRNNPKATQKAIVHLDHALEADPDNLYALEGKGEALWRLGRAEEAAALLQRAVTLSDAGADVRRQTTTRLKLAQILIALQRWAEARPLIDQGLQGDPALRPQLILARGWCYLAGGEAEQARALAEEVLAGAGADPAIRIEALTQRASALLQLGDYAGANEDARAALDHAPNHQQALRIRAEALIRDPASPELEKGIQLLQIYLRTNPGDVAGLRLLVEALRRAGRPASAIVEALEQGLPVLPGEIQEELQLELAAAYLDDNQAEKALATLRRITPAEDGKQASRWWWVDGAARATLGDLDRALESYHQAVTLDADNVPLIEEHARLLAQSGRPGDALALWEIARAVPAGRGRATLEIARLHRQQAQWSEALEAVQAALVEYLEPDQRQEALALKCALAEEASLPPQEVAQAFLDAGTFYYDNNQTDQAITALRRARQLDPALALAGWYLADALLVKSYLPEPPYVDRQQIEEALAVWEETAKVEEPGEELLWPLLTRAYIAERLAYLPGASFLPLVSQAALLAERALLRGGGPYYDAALARFHRALENYATAFAAAERAYENAPDVAFIVDEYVLSLAHMSRFEEAEALITERENLQPGDWLTSIHAFVLGQQGRVEDAIRVLDAAAEATPDDLWTRSYRGDCYRRLGQTESAREDYAWVWQQRADPQFGYAGNLGLFGPAGYGLAVLTPGLDESILREAAGLLAEYTGFSASAPYAHLMLGLCHLALAELDEAERHLRRGVDLASSARLLNDFQRDEIAPLEKLAEPWPHAAEARALLKKAEAWIEEQLAALTPPLAPAQELERFLARLPEEERRLSWTWMGVQAGIARLYGEAGEWGRAAEVYRQLRQADELFGVFPETGAGIATAVGGLLQQGDGFLAGDEIERATEVYETAGRLIEQMGAVAGEDLAAVDVRLGYAAFRRGDLKGASAAFTRAVDTSGEALLQSSGSRLGDVARRLLRDEDDYWTLNNFWQEQAADPAVEAGFRGALNAARQTLAAFHDEALQLARADADSTSQYPVVTPIAVELGAGLIPEDTSMEWSLFKELIPALRERINSHFGVLIPGVRVRGDEGTMPPYRYLFLLDEVPLLMDQIKPDRRFCPRAPADVAAMGIPADELEEAVDPVSGEPGCWVPLARAGRLEEAGLPLWRDPLAYVVRQLEALLENHLSRYMGPQEVAVMFNSWNDEPHLAALAQRAQPDEDSRLRFVWLVQALLDEKVPVTDWETILQSVTATGLPDRDVSGPLQAVRLALREQLPGNRPDVIHLTLPPSLERTLESWLQRENGASFLALPPEVTQEALAEVRALLAPHEGSPNLALVVSSGELRLPVRRLIALEFPQLMVLSRDELLAEMTEEIKNGRR